VRGLYKRPTRVLVNFLKKLLFFSNHQEANVDEVHVYIKNKACQKRKKNKEYYMRFNKDYLIGEEDPSF